jgi:hypothetical protein
MPVISFMALLGGGLLVWTGYLGQPLGKVVKAVLDGNSKTLTKIPLDPDKRTTSAPITSSGNGDTGRNAGGGNGGGGGGSF